MFSFNTWFKIIIIFVFGLSLVTGQNSSQNGIIKGRLIDKETLLPLAGANIEILNSTTGAASDENGSFIINAVPPGSYTLKFSYIGYESLIKTDVIIRPDRTTYLDAELRMSELLSESIAVTADYFSTNDEQVVSTINFSAEEIRRAPGSGGDVSRILMSLPSVAKINDQSNSLIVRGGSPLENSFYVDNIEIPNINHFPTQGASGGPIGLLNVDFIKDVNFQAGGFDASFGDRLSSVMDINFREGNHDEFDGQLDLNFAGFGGTFEGPVPGSDASFMLSLRRSYLDILVDAIDIGTSVAPRYGDYQGKITYDLNQNHRLTFLGIFSDDHNNPDHKAAIENDMIYYGNQDIYENTVGLNWRAIWNSNAYSNTSVSYTSYSFINDSYETNSENLLLTNDSREQEYKIRNVNHLRVNEKNAIEFGIEAKSGISRYNSFYAGYTDALGDSTAELTVNKTIKAQKYAVFLNYLTNPLARLNATIGLRAEYFSYNKEQHLSPRFSLAYNLSERTTLKASAGIYYQTLPTLLFAQQPGNRNLKDMRAEHYILGLDYLLTESTKLSLEMYRKNYSDFPVDPAQPALFLVDELYYRYGYFFNHGQLDNSGEARSDGAEIIVQKKLAEDFYGLISASYFTSRYKTEDGKWINRVYDNRFVGSVEGGYKPNNKWEFSLRWIVAGGAPYTPFDLQESQRLKRGVLDEQKINSKRYPAYHSLNVRFDRRFHYNASNLVFYLSVWNVYNRKNIATYFWNENENKKDVIYQWGILPIFGLEYEF